MHLVAHLNKTGYPKYDATPRGALNKKASPRDLRTVVSRIQTRPGTRKTYAIVRGPLVEKGIPYEQTDLRTDAQSENVCVREPLVEKGIPSEQTDIHPVIVSIKIKKNIKNKQNKNKQTKQTIPRRSLKMDLGNLFTTSTTIFSFKPPETAKVVSFVLFGFMFQKE